MRAIIAGTGVALLLLLSPPAVAGSNSGSSNQSGSSSSGDAVGGPSVSVARAGNVRVIATNVSNADAAPVHTVAVTPGEVVSMNVQGPSSAVSGDASGSNSATTFVGVASSRSSLADVLTSALE